MAANKYALIVDYKYCDGCNSCVVACRKEKGMALDEWGIGLKEIGPEKINGKWMWSFVPYVSKRCDLCADRINEGKKPSCVQHCLSACMYAVPIREVGAKLDELGDEVAVLVP